MNPSNGLEIVALPTGSNWNGALTWYVGWKTQMKTPSASTSTMTSLASMCCGPTTTSARSLMLRPTLVASQRSFW